MNLSIEAAFLLIALAAYGGVVWLLNWTRRRQMLDIPNDRSSHSVPTPRGGGLVIVLLTLGAAGVYCAINGGWRQGAVYIAGGALIAFLGWRDDVRSLSPRVRFAVQGLVAAGMIAGLGYFESVTLPLLGTLRLGWVGIPITFFWIVGLTNAYNFMDGIDGIAGGVGLAAGLGWMLLSAPAGGLENGLAFWIALTLAAGCLGFLALNWPPARIFMGDVASTFLGFTFAVLPLFSAARGGDALLLGVTVLWVIIMDAGVTFIRRAIRREVLFQAHRTHLYQRMVISGVRVAWVSGLFVALTLAGGGLAIAWTRGLAVAAPLILIGLPLLWAGLTWWTRRRERA